MAKSHMRYLAIALLILGGQALPGQVPPPVRIINVTREVHAFFDSIAKESLTHRVETGGCISGYIVTDSSLVITQVTGARYERADSISIRMKFPGMCPWGQPMVHTHIDGIPDGSPFPSYPDMSAARIRGTWSLILNVRPGVWALLLY